MQLPRGTFRSIQKGVTLAALLQELNTSLFSGYCTISAGTVATTLVLDRGRCVLAEYRHLVGDDAWKRILEMEGAEVDAELCDLSSTQMQLALEFNRSAAVGRSQAISDLFGHVPSAKKDKEVVLDWLALQKPDLTSKPRNPNVTAPVKEQQRSTSDLQVQDAEGYANINRDLEALDAMDLERMAEKIRLNCKRTVRRLHLGHLIEDE